jgi:uncharacterized membrane protein YoaK (UPF0700 family)
MEAVGVTTAVASPSTAAEEPSDEARTLSRIPPLLSVVAGMVEVLGLLMLGGLFTGHVTGNIVVIAALLVRGGSPTAPQLLAVPTFIAALAVVWLIARASGRRGLALLRPLLFVQFVLLVGVMLLAISASTSMQSDPSGTRTSFGAILATSALACQFATMRLVVPGAPSTAVMTGNVTNAVLSFLDMIHRGTPLLQPDVERFRKATSLVVGFCAGCVAGALGAFLLKDWSWTLPVGLAAAAVATVPRSFGRQRGARRPPR